MDSIAKEVAESGSEDHRRYCSLLLDEVKIQEDLVYKSATGELIGFVELSNVDQILSKIESEANGTRSTDQPLATHVLQWMVQGITSSVEATYYAYFPTKTLKDRQSVFDCLGSNRTNTWRVETSVFWPLFRMERLSTDPFISCAT